MKTYARKSIPAALALPLVLAAAVIAAGGCASAPRPGGKRGTLQGMIRDYDNKPVAGYLVSVDERDKAYTDINGRFTVPDLALGAHTLSGEGRDHGTYEQSVEFADRTQIIYLRIPSNRFLYSQIDRELTEGEYGKAQQTLLQFSKEEQKSRKYNLYKTIMLFHISPDDSRAGYYAKARKLTEELLDE